MKRKILITILILSLMLVGVIGAGVSIIDKINKEKKDFDIDLDANVKEWTDNHITNSYWIGDSLEVWNNENKFIQKFNYTLDGKEIIERHKLIENYEIDSLYCVVYNETICYEYSDECILWKGDVCLEFDCMFEGGGECLEWDRYGIEEMLTSARKEKAEKVYNGIYSSFNKPVPVVIDTGDKTPQPKVK